MDPSVKSLTRASVSAAAGFVLLYLSSVIPWGRLAILCAATIGVVFVRMSCSCAWALGCYAVTAALGILLLPVKSPSLLYGLFLGYYLNEENTREVWHDGLYHTGDTAWRDEDGYFWYVGRVDDVIKSSGYRIGPFEIESVIMELPYVLECGVSAAPDEIRGQVVKASVVLVKGTEGTEELKKEIQNYVKKRTAPYKYPRIVVFRDELPKTISGKIIRNKL